MAVIAVVAVVLIYLWLGPAVSERGRFSRGARTFTYRIMNTYPHDPEAFTQGLVFEGGYLYEGTGLRGRSSLRKVDLETGEVLMIQRLDDHYFGEGITVYGKRIIQLTLAAQTGFVYDMATFDPLQEFTYPLQGWGLTHNGQHLIMSDGTSMLYFLDPATFRRVDQLIVKDGDRPVIGLNELEYIDGDIYANVWQTDLIARISPGTGRVTAWIDLTGLLPPEDSAGAGVLNGIAYDEESDRLFVTGKLWPRLFEIEWVGVRH